MISVLSAIVPIVGILLLGKAIATTRIISDEGWLGLESITYYVLFPALIVSKLAVADFEGLDWRMPVTLVSAQLVMAGTSIAAGIALKQSGKRIGVFVQSGVRWNTFIALALAQDLIGPEGIIFIAAAAAAMVPTSNLLSIVALTRFSNGEMGMGVLLRQVIANPLILAFIVGFSINAIGIELAPSLITFLDVLAEGAIAMGLLTSGAYIQFRNGTTPAATILGWSTFRLFGMPLAAGAIALLLDLSPEIFLVVLIATAVPTASNGAILARKLGGDATLAANLIAAQTILALISFTSILSAAEALRLISYAKP